MSQRCLATSAKVQLKAWKMAPGPLAQLPQPGNVQKEDRFDKGKTKTKQAFSKEPSVLQTLFIEERKEHVGGGSSYKYLFLLNSAQFTLKKANISSELAFT